VNKQRPPLAVAALGVVAVVFFALPFVGLLWRAPWSDLGHILWRHDVRTALWLSLRTSLIATLLAAVFGVPLAWLLARTGFPGRRVVRALATMSMVLPPVVGGMTLLFSVGRKGLFGGVLHDWFGLTLSYSTVGVVVAQMFVSMPFLVLAVEGAIHQSDPRFEGAARTLGGSEWYVFRRITLPAIRSGLAAGMALAWARAFGEFGATITFAGNFPGRTQTVSIATYLALDVDQRDAMALSVLMIAVSLLVLVGLRDRWLGHERRVTW
jgi:molybdate transport system permease protein